MGKELEATLAVENLRVKAKHGWYEEERVIGGMYTINVRMFHSVRDSEQFDDLSASINYEVIYKQVLDVMQNEFHLIEHCCKSIFNRMKSLDQNAIWEVELIKEEPPLKFVGNTSFTLKG
ncbi:FolB domain-containing protein [bacterium]|nr:FolB domain-containing protein [bacterium]